MKIQCIDRDVRQILESGIYVIPRFQRPYSWDRDNVEEFWSDSISEIKSDYFIGAFVAYAISSSLHGIVDGQQRLTTITIALCAVRDKYQEIGLVASAKGVHRLIETRDLNDETQFVLRAETSYPYLQAKIQAFEKDDEKIDAGEEEKAIKVAYDVIRSKIDEKCDKISTKSPRTAKDKIKKWLDEIRDKILSLKVISITLDTQDDAYIIFETLNTRGKDLTAADLAKNHFLRLLPAKAKSVDRPKDHWLEMQSNLEQASKPISLKTYLHHYWLSKYPFTTEKQLFKSIKSHVRADNAKIIMQQLKEDSELYRGISDPDHLRLWGKQNADIKETLFCISNVLNIQIANPFILSALRLYRDKKIKDSQARELLELVEKYHYTYTTICAFPSSGGVGQMYAAHARELTNASDSNEIGRHIRDFKNKIRDRIPRREIFVSRFRSLSYANSRHRDLIRYTLWRIEKSRNKALDITRSTGSIEHLSPQASNAPGVNSVGNLILVPARFNCEVLKARKFSEKKKLLQDAGYPLDSMVKKVNTWGTKEIEERATELAEYAYDSVWTIK